MINSSSGILTNGTDADGDSLTAQLVSGPTNGNLQLNSSGSFVYTPDTGFIGTDSFTYEASDGLSMSAPATVTITVNQVVQVNSQNSAYSAIVSADFNGDSKPDLAVVDQGLGTVSIYLNSGNGTLVTAPVSTIPVGLAPVAILAADFNGDGRQDLAVANSGSNTVSILLGNGDGTFTTGTTLTGFNDPVALVVGEFDGDTQPDLAVVNKGSNSVSILTGNGNGTFTSAGSLTTGSSPTAIAAGDFNNDGKTDLVVTNSGSNTVSVFLGNGNGTFQSPLTDAVGTAPAAIAVADFNHDGLPDLAVADSGSNDVSILFGLGGGAFTTPTVYPVGTDPVALAVGDLNGVGNLDVAVLSAGANEITYLSNMGNGTFYDTCEVPTPESPSAIALADFNGDQSVDAVVAFRNPAGFTLAFGNTTQNMPGQPVAPQMPFTTVALSNYQKWIDDVNTLPGFKDNKVDKLSVKAIKQLFTWNAAGYNYFNRAFTIRLEPLTPAEKLSIEQQSAVVTVLQAQYSYIVGASYDWLPPWKQGVTKNDFNALNKAFGAGKTGATNMEKMYEYSLGVIQKTDQYLINPVLWQRGGPDYTKTHQGNIGDCHFISALDALAAVNKRAVMGTPVPGGQKGTGLIWSTGEYSKGTLKFWVQWPNDKTPVEVRMPTLPELAFYSYAEDGLWVTLLEIAYLAKRQGNPFYSFFDKAMPDSFKNGDMIQNSLKLLTSNPDKIKLALIAKAPVDNKNLYNTINNAITNNKMVTAGTWRIKDLLPRLFKSTDIPPPNGHAYTVYGVIPGPNPQQPWVGALIKIRNPWGDPGQPYGEAFNYPIDKFRTNFFAIAWES